MKPEQRETFHQALLSAYPGRSDLERMLTFRLGWELSHIAGEGPQSDTVYKLVRYAKTEGKLSELLQKAYDYKSGNPELRQFYDSMRAPAGAAPAAPASDGSAGTEPAGAPAAAPLRLVLGYSPKDSELARRLEQQLTALVRAQLVTPPWSAAKISAGQVTATELSRHYEAADIIVLLLSAELFATCDDVLQRAQRRYDAGALVVPVVARPVLTEFSWLHGLRAYPRDSDDKVRSVTTWNNQDEAWMSVIEGIHRAIRERQARR